MIIDYVIKEEGGIKITIPCANQMAYEQAKKMHETMGADRLIEFINSIRIYDEEN